ncbi:hypothetical protein POTOM_016574 [Populus tomentosa]|uniref:Peroxisomal membrane 22 kDa (Mpv17/PMP22) family protein n=1 Tax=Populus tomentosa TaxID=118781 RepID=A0A8X7ZX94_POPTO|nr:hypothetical protein POTOM_016574 [Populus tomentosa]
MQAITAGVFSAASDIVAQKLSSIQKLQIKRILLKVLFGFGYLGPFGHFLHLMLEKMFKGKKDTATVAKEVAVEQLTASPWNNLVFMIDYEMVIDGKKTLDASENQTKKGIPSSAAHIMDGIALSSLQSMQFFWPVDGWVNHQYVPLQFRVIFHNLIAVGWYLLRLQPALLYFKFSLSNFTENEI